MHYYKVFGYVFRCRDEIRQLYEIPCTGHYDADILLGEMPAEIMDAASLTAETPSSFWNNDYFWLKNRYGILAVYKSGQIYAHNPDTADILYLLQFVLGYGIAIYAHMHNRIALHCGCVAIAGNAVIISGSSGSGKSTLTHELIADGATMLSDDVVAIGYDKNNRPCIYPAFPQQKLCRDAALSKGYRLENLLYIDPEKDKFAVMHTAHFSPDPHYPHTFLYLQCLPKTESKDTRHIQIRKIDGYEKVALIMRCLYLGALIQDFGLSARAFQLCVDFVKESNVWQISRPSEIDTLSDIMDFVKHTLQLKGEPYEA